MAKSSTLFTVAAIFCLLLIFTPSHPYWDGRVKAGPPPNDPHTGTGNDIDVFEFARNDSITFTDGTNDTTFLYSSSWYPVGYRGYGLYTYVSNLGKTTDPVPNGDFDQYDEPGNNWTLTFNDAGIVKSVDNTTGGNPGYCLDVELKGAAVRLGKQAYIDNDFTYTSSLEPDLLTVYFDIMFSSDITANVKVKVAILYPTEYDEVGQWSRTTDVFAPQSWSSQSFSTTAVNGTCILRIVIEKAKDNGFTGGDVYFDNFRYIISNPAKPSEVGLTLNGTAFTDSILNSGEVTIYADAANEEEAPLVNCWDTDQLFQFDSTYDDIRFDYEYTMFIKHQETNGATATFTAPIGQNPTWEVNYTIPSGRPPLGYDGYSYGVFLRAEWTLVSVKNSTGDDYAYTYNSTSLFVQLNEIQNPIGKTFSIYASSPNYVLQIYPQKGPTSGGPWTNLSAGEYYIQGDWMRVQADLRPISASGNANISLFFPNRSLWQSDGTPAFDINKDRVTSTEWQIPQIENTSAGSDWLITVSFDNGTQCGMLDQSFSVVIETAGTKISPADGIRVIWGDTVLVNVTWKNMDNDVNITDAATRIRYVDRNLIVRYEDMVPNGLGAYSLDFATNLMEPSLTAKFYVELFRYGYVNASYGEGTHLTYTINLVNDINYVMITPTQQTGTDEYTAETSSTQGYTSQVKFYDPYQAAYVRNDTSVWQNHTFVEYTYYEDPTGPTGWTEISTGSFVPNVSNPVIFYKYDSFYFGVERVRYNVTMRIIGAPWNYEQQNFTIIIKIVKFATNLDAYRTVIDYPPSGTGDGWTQYNNNTDSYEVRLYWREEVNITVFYENVSTSIGITSATVKALIGSSLHDLTEKSGGYYYYILNTTKIGIGATDLYVNATYLDHATQTIRLRVIVSARATQLTKDQPGATAQLPYDDDFSVTFTFNDTVAATPAPIIDASWSITGYSADNYTVQNHVNGSYTITFWGNVSETTYYVTIIFSRNNYTSQTQFYEITIRPIHTQASGSAQSVSVPWGDMVIITLYFNDTDHFYQGIPGATISFSWFDNIEGVDFWITDHGDGSYTITLNTTKCPVGTFVSYLSFTLSEDHYDSKQVYVNFEVRDMLTALYIFQVTPSTSIAWGDNLTIILTFNDTDHSYASILEAIISCDWDPFFWSYSYNATLDAYVLTIRTLSRNEGSYTIQITATKPHYTSGFTLQGFIIRYIQTGYTADPPYVSSHPWGDNLTIRVNYLDIDHGLKIPYADVSLDWDAGFFTIYYFGNGTYDIVLNTTCRSIGTHLLTLELSREHYANRSVPITIVLDSIPIIVDILVPTGGQKITDYNDLVVITVNVTDLHGHPINDAIARYHWASRNPVTMTFIGDGIYNVSFLANATIGTYIISIEVTKTNYQTGIGTVILGILPIETDFSVLTPTIEAVVGDSFTISVNFTTISGVPINDATVLFSWAGGNGQLSLVAPGIYNATVNSLGLEIGLYSVYVTASSPNVVERMGIINVNLTVIPTALEPEESVLRVYWGDNFTVQVFFRNRYTESGIDGATIQYFWGPQNGTLQPSGQPGWYNTTLSSTIFTADSSYRVTLTADFSGFDYALTSITVYIDPQPTELNLNQVETYYPEANLHIPLNGTSWRVPWGDILILTFNFTDAYGQPIVNATGVYNWGLGTGNLVYSDGLYIAQINLTGVTPDIYFLSVTLSRQNYQIARVTQYQLEVTLIETAIIVIYQEPEIYTGAPFSVIVSFNDTFHGLGITDAELTFTITTLQLDPIVMTNNGDGTYTISGISIPNAALHSAIIQATGSANYASSSIEIALPVTTNPAVQSFTLVGVIAALLGVILIAIWLAYSKIFAIPWLVRKMRSMSKTIGKGKTPALSKRDIGRIATRPDQMIHIVEPSYDVIRIPIPLAAVPSVQELDERFAEDDVIWEQLKELPSLKTDQKMELFQEMKRIPATERVWFIEDLKRQMADGTRFARLPKEPLTPKVPPEVEAELKQRLATFPDLSKAERDRMFSQLREMPKEEWDEIFSTLTLMSAKRAEEEKLLYDEFPALTQEEKQRLLKELEGLSEEEKQKVLQTFREKHAEQPPEAKVVKGKRKFEVEEEEEN